MSMERRTSTECDVKDETSARSGREMADAVAIWVVYGAIVLIAEALGIALSLLAQRGGITPGNALLAILLGPWSPILSPNAHPPATWSEGYAVFSKCMTIIVPAAAAGSYFCRRSWCKHMAITTAVITLVLWVVFGLLKVLMELV